MEPTSVDDAPVIKEGDAYQKVGPAGRDCGPKPRSGLRDGVGNRDKRQPTGDGIEEMDRPHTVRFSHLHSRQYHH